MSNDIFQNMFNIVLPFRGDFGYHQSEFSLIILLLFELCDVNQWALRIYLQLLGESVDLRG
jgi:hypothetical protein